MIHTVDEAKKLVLDYFNDEIVVASGVNIITLDEETMGKDYGWIFKVETRQYLETGLRRYKLWGVGSVIVSKNGSIHICQARYGLNTNLKLYEAKIKPSLVRKLTANWHVFLEEIGFLLRK